MRVGDSMRLMSRFRWPGLLAAWLAIAALLGGVGGDPARMLAMQNHDGVPVCGAHDGASGGPGHPADHRDAMDCALCGCCAPLVAVLAAPPQPRPPVRILVAEIAPRPPARAPPAAPLTAAYPRGPPASI
jgi:hypothetical protein